MLKQMSDKTPSKMSRKTRSKVSEMNTEPLVLSRPTVETLIDLVEIKLGCIEIYDRDDARELKALEACRDELMVLRASGALPKKAMLRPAESQAESQVAMETA
jgi:hypothetical protein